MADVGPRLVLFPPISNPGRPPSRPQLPPRLDTLPRRPAYAPQDLVGQPPHDGQAGPSMAARPLPAPPTLKTDFGAVGTGIAYGGMHPAAAPGPALGPPPPNPLNINILKSLADKKTTRDGQPAKRRGPKPDSKPALTRRQELNRQAQRTHRERKEHYIKALEDEVLRLREYYTDVSNSRERLIEENRSLRALLQQNGLPVPIPMDEHLSPPSAGPYMGSNSTASPSGSASYGLPSATTQHTPFTPPHAASLSPAGVMPPGAFSPSQGQQQPQQQQQQQQQQVPTGLSPTRSPGVPKVARNPAIDYDQAGINFVLSLEKPCMDHMPWLLERSHAKGGLDPSGHALMASCPPEPFSQLAPEVPFGTNYGAATAAPPPRGVGVGGTMTAGAGSSRTVARQHQHQQQQQASSATPMDVDSSATPRTWEMSKADLATLLELSQKLNLDGEITPVMAWRMVLGHPRLRELTGRDFAKLADELRGRVRCYGFGAVMEEFEVRDALEACFSTKPEPR